MVSAEPVVEVAKLDVVVVIGAPVVVSLEVDVVSEIVVPILVRDNKVRKFA